jgi:hypothetical protein
MCLEDGYMLTTVVYILIHLQVSRLFVSMKYLLTT